MACLLAGCAGGHLGLVAARCTQTDTACVVESRSVGPAIQWGRGGWALSFGIRRAIDIHPRVLEDGSWTPWDGWRWIYAPLPDEAPLKQIANTTGADFYFDSGGSGIDFGFSQRMLTAAPLTKEGVSWRISYSDKNPSNTRVNIQKP